MAAKKVKKRKKHKHNPVLNWLGYIAMRIALAILFLFGIRRSLRFGCYLGTLMWKHYHRGRNRAMENLRASFPEKDEKWLEAVGLRSFQQIVMLAIDVFFTPRLLDKHNWSDYITPINIERAKWMSKENKGLLMLTGHYGNFEIAGYLMGSFLYNVYSIARPLDNPYINKYLYGIREMKGQKIIDKKGAAEQMVQLVEDGATLCFICDQDAGRKGVFVDFFGRKASSYKSIGLLAIQYNLPIAVGACRRVGNDYKFEIELGRIIEPAEWADKEDPLKWVTQEYNAELERLIRKDPTQYWWLHRRWKTRPKAERRAKR